MRDEHCRAIVIHAVADEMADDLLRRRAAEPIDLLPETGACSFEEIVFANLAEHGGLEAEVVDHEFYDIGTPDELARTRKALE